MARCYRYPLQSERSRVPAHPGRLHDPALQFFADVEANNEVPVYKCPFIDPAWKMDRIEQALATV